MGENHEKKFNFGYGRNNIFSFGDCYVNLLLVNLVDGGGLNILRKVGQ